MANDDTSPGGEVLLTALEDLLDITEANIARARRIRRRIAKLRRQVDAGTPLVEAIRHEDKPLIVELITDNIAALQAVGARLRWAEATALRNEGMSAADIARLFGVSRQRVSALLNSPPAAVTGSGD